MSEKEAWHHLAEFYHSGCDESLCFGMCTTLKRMCHHGKISLEVLSQMRHKINKALVYTGKSADEHMFELNEEGSKLRVAFCNFQMTQTLEP